MDGDVVLRGIRQQAGVFHQLADGVLAGGDGQAGDEIGDDSLPGFRGGIGGELEEHLDAGGGG